MKCSSKMEYISSSSKDGLQNSAERRYGRVATVASLFDLIESCTTSSWSG